MSYFCCSDYDNHYWCRKIGFSPCSGFDPIIVGRPGSHSDSPPRAPDMDKKNTLPPWIRELEEELNNADHDPTPEQLLLFAQVLTTFNFNRDTLIVTRHIEENVPLNKRLLHSKNYLIQAQAFEALGEARAAKTSLQMAKSLANTRTVRSRLDGAFDRVLTPVDRSDSQVE